MINEQGNVCTIACRKLIDYESKRERGERQMAIITLKRTKEGILTRHADISREKNGQERP